jgi:methylenetetrahydrofolate reductase (NADPH)
MISRQTPQTYWGDPKTTADLTNVFLRYLHSELPSTPFSPDPLSPESLLILPHLERLTRRGLWTVGSQPAVDGAHSTDPVLGWGPVNGYVFQKAFVEFFAEKSDVEWIERAAAASGGWIHYFAANLEVRFYTLLSMYRGSDYGDQGEGRTNIPEGGSNSVTWGVFPGQEITNSTIIGQESFLSWKVSIFALIVLLVVADVDHFTNRKRHSQYGRIGHLITLRIHPKEHCLRMLVGRGGS